MKKMCGILLLMTTFYTTLEANSQIKRFQVGEQETGRYLEYTNAGDPYICHYYSGNGWSNYSEKCLNKNKNENTAVKQAYMFPGTGSFPACPPLPAINKGYWVCPLSVFPNSVEVYASCAARCFSGFKLTEEKVIRCPESLVWEHLAGIHCISENDFCSISSLNNITSTPREVSLAWNASLACQDANFTLVMSGPSQKFTRQLQKNSNFIVIKNIQPDVVYEVLMYLKEELLISGKFKSAAVVCPQRPVDVHVHTLNTTAVNITWAATGDDRFITGYMVNITCDENWFTQNTTENAVILSLLETGRNYTISVKAYNHYCLGLYSDLVFYNLPEKEEDLPGVNDSRWVIVIPVIISVIVVLLLATVVCFCVCKRKRLGTHTSKAIERSDRSRIEMCDSMITSNTEARVANNTESPTYTTTLLSSQYPLNDSTSDSSELLSASGPDAPHTASSNNDLKSCLEQLKQVNVKERNGHQKRAPGSDSGRGSDTGTDCTGYDCDKLRSSQGSEKSLQEEVCEGNDYKHQNPTGSADIESDCKHQNPTASANNGSDCKHQNPTASDAENCTCTISKFLNSENSLEYIDRLADLLDPHEHYTDQRSWKGLAVNVLHLEHTKVIAIGHRSRNAFKDEILEYLTSKGKRLGHLVYYFSRENTYRKDVIKLIGEIHSECSFCEKFFGSQQPS